MHWPAFYTLAFFHEAFFATQTTNFQSTYQPLFAFSAASARCSLYHCFSFSFFILSPIAAHPIKQSSFHGLRYIGSGACVTWSRTVRPHCSKRLGRDVTHLSHSRHVVTVEQPRDDKERSLTLITEWQDLLVLYKLPMIACDLGVCIIAFLCLLWELRHPVSLHPL